MRTSSFGERVAHCKLSELSAMSCAETTEPIDLLFGFVDLEEAQVQSYSQGGTIVQKFQSYSSGCANEPDDTLP